jgi:hypothetical protein
VTEEELLTLWADRAHDPEAQMTCVYALGMTMGRFLVDLAENPDQNIEVAQELAGTVYQLRELLLDAGADLHLIEEIWVQFQAATLFDGKTIWDHLMEDPPSSRG